MENGGGALAFRHAGNLLSGRALRPRPVPSLLSTALLYVLLNFCSFDSSMILLLQKEAVRA
jgi:hypothetical protein